MNQAEMFGNALLVGSPKGNVFSILRGHFSLKKKGKALLRCVGLGFFECFVNGVKVSEDKFLPLASDYEPRKEYPVGEELTGHRLYVPEYDISHLVKEGDNLIALHFGGGWYATTSYMYAPNSRYGDAKAIWKVETEEGNFGSSTADFIADSYIKEYEFTTHEFQDKTLFDQTVFTPDFDESSLAHAVIAKKIDTSFYTTDCPADRVCERIIPCMICEKEGIRVYDAGKNLSGVPVLRLGKESFAEVYFSEELTPENLPDPAHHFRQEYRVKGKPGETVQPDFTWFGFRYFGVKGDAEPLYVDFLHTNVPVTASFDCDDEMLNWIFQTAVHTELCNLHAGIPSDCPHIERQGYTGDGELTALSMMTVADMKAFYRKWIGDILDCQDKLTGHVQYTAPYFRCGGGPGAWGCAIVEMPYLFYKQYGEDDLAKIAYPQMKKYFDYLEAHSENGLVVSDKEGEWCLGEWCTQTKVVLPAAFINNYYYVRSLQRAIELAERFGYTADVTEFEKRIALRKKALMSAYYNTWDSNFFGCLQGANAFMTDIGLGNEQTYRNLVEHYRSTGALDTGICGTEVLIRVLFAHGDGELAVQLLSPEKPVAFRGWKEKGATTFWEYFCDSTRVRSHNHPMFGSAITNYFRYLLGIQDAGDAGFSSLHIAPFMPQKLHRMAGKCRVPAGEVAVFLQRQEEKIAFTVTLPQNLNADFSYGGHSFLLHGGTNEFVL